MKYRMIALIQITIMLLTCTPLTSALADSKGQIGSNIVVSGTADVVVDSSYGFAPDDLFPFIYTGQTPYV